MLVIISNSLIYFYSKVGCSPCVFLKDILKKRFDENMYEIIEFDTDEQVFENILKFGVKTVPFAIYKDKLLKGEYLFNFILKGKIGLETFEPSEVFTD